MVSFLRVRTIPRTMSHGWFPDIPMPSRYTEYLEGIDYTLNYAEHANNFQFPVALMIRHHCTLCNLWQKVIKSSIMCKRT